MRAAKHCAELEASKKHREALEHIKSLEFEDVGNLNETRKMTPFSYVPDVDSSARDLHNNGGNDLLFLPSSLLLQNLESSDYVGLQQNSPLTI